MSAEPVSPPPVAAAPRKRATWLRISLRSLLLLTLLLGSAGSLYYRWAPWRLEEVVRLPMSHSVQHFDWDYCDGILEGDEQTSNWTWINVRTQQRFKLQSVTPVAWPHLQIDGLRFLTVHTNNAVVVWDSADARQLAMLIPPGQSEIIDLATAPSKRRIYVLTADYLGLYDADSFQELKRIPVSAKKDIDSIWVTHDQSLLVLYHDPWSLAVYGSEDLDLIRCLGNINYATVKLCSEKHGPCTIRVDSSRKNYEIVALRTDETIFLEPVPPDRFNVNVSQDGRRIIFNSKKRARIMDADGRRLCDIPRADIVWRATLTPDGQRCFLSSEADLKTQIWDVATGRLLTTMDVCIEPQRFNANGSSCETIETASVDRFFTIKRWRKVRDEATFGIIKLPEFWTTALLAIALLLSLVRDWRVR